MSAEPLGRDLHFVLVDGGKVHVLPDREDEQSVTLVRFSDVTDDMALSLALGHLVARCGTLITQHRGGLQASARPVSDFPDDALCQRCYYTVPEDERDRLFDR